MKMKFFSLFLMSWWLFLPAGVTANSKLPLALPSTTRTTPIKNITGASFDFSKISASAVLVMDVNSATSVLERLANETRPLASITKLMTALVLRDRKIPNSKKITLIRADEVGGARLRVSRNSQVSTTDLFYAMLVGSANNAANALARSTGLSRRNFVATMNKKAKSMGLSSKFVDPSGISPKNLASARDVARLGLKSFNDPLIRIVTTTPVYNVTVYPAVRKLKNGRVIRAAQVVHPIKNTDDILTDDTTTTIVGGGKTGYLSESKWNFVTRLSQNNKPPLLVVVLGSDNRRASFADAQTLANFVWENFE